MKNILEAPLRALTSRRLLVALDFDGTLAPIVRVPEAAAMRPSTAELLAEVAKHYPCVVISGRARADVQKRLRGIPLRAVLGNHGMEPGRGLAAARKAVARWRRELGTLLPKVPGLIIEDKRASLAIHYRRASARSERRQQILAAVDDLRDARVVEGKMVINVLPKSAPDKGVALLLLCKRLRCEAALYVGDDITDEDAFGLADRFPVLGVRVGRARRSHAVCFLPSQADIDQLLTLLVRLRHEEPGAVHGFVEESTLRNVAHGRRLRGTSDHALRRPGRGNPSS
jgi:trehalose 6-phosphate phosphatase